MWTRRKGDLSGEERKELDKREEDKGGKKSERSRMKDRKTRREGENEGEKRSRKKR